VPGREFLDDLWRDMCGLPEHPKHGMLPSSEVLMKTEWCEAFEKLMRNRLAFGFFRYGKLGRKKAKFDRVGNMHARLDLYMKTGNVEHVVDGANLAMVEFVEGRNSGKLLTAHDDCSHSKESLG